MYNAPGKFIDQLLRAYPDLDAVGSVQRRSDGQTVRQATALHMALESGHLRLATQLIKAGTAVGKVNSLGETPLLTFIKASKHIPNFEREAPNMVRLLLEREVPLGVQDLKGRSDLALTTRQGQWELASMLSHQPGQSLKSVFF